MPEQLTLYAAKFSPYVESIELALKEANAQYTRFDINLQEKPAWFTEKVNPFGKVPAISYGGPIVPPDQPSPESLKIPESSVILEFIADTYPQAKLLPADPAGRAAARLFAYVIASNTIALKSVMVDKKSPEVLVKVLEQIQALLPSKPGTFAVGDHFTIADATAAPLLFRAMIWFKHDHGSYPAGEGLQAYQLLSESPRFARLRDYHALLKQRHAVQELIVEDALIKQGQEVSKTRSSAPSA